MAPSSDFDPTDTKHQVSDDFKPDKESTWPHPPERDGWVLVHNSLRGEMNICREAFAAMKERGRPLKPWEIQVIQTAAAVHIENISLHHQTEDEVFTPELVKRFHYPDKLQGDHKALEKKLDTVSKTVNDLKEQDTIDHLLTEWIAYEDMMKPHLQHEEDTALPLYRAYFTKEDAKPLIQKVIANSPKLQLGAMVYFEGEDSFRSNFMIQEGIPSFVWYIDFNFRYKAYIKAMVNGLEALKNGVEPETERPRCILL